MTRSNQQIKSQNKEVMWSDDRSDFTNSGDESGDSGALSQYERARDPIYSREPTLLPTDWRLPAGKHTEHFITSKPALNPSAKHASESYREGSTANAVTNQTEGIGEHNYVNTDDYDKVISQLSKLSNRLDELSQMMQTVFKVMQSNNTGNSATATAGTLGDNHKTVTPTTTGQSRDSEHSGALNDEGRNQEKLYIKLSWEDYVSFMNNLHTQLSANRIERIEAEIESDMKWIAKLIHKLPNLSHDYKVKHKYIKFFDIIGMDHPGIMEFFKSDPISFNYDLIKWTGLFNEAEKPLFYNVYMREVMKLLIPKVEKYWNLESVCDFPELVNNILAASTVDYILYMDEVLSALVKIIHFPKRKNGYREPMQRMHESFYEVIQSTPLHTLMFAYACANFTLFSWYRDASDRNKQLAVVRLATADFLEFFPDRICDLIKRNTVYGVDSHYEKRDIINRIPQIQELFDAFPRTPDRKKTWKR